MRISFRCLLYITMFIFSLPSPPISYSFQNYNKRALCESWPTECLCICDLVMFLQEADIEHRSQSLKKEGFWSTKRLTRLTEPVRPKVHWDYLCEEMQWLSADFAQERRWKRGVARKVCRKMACEQNEHKQQTSCKQHKRKTSVFSRP